MSQSLEAVSEILNTYLNRYQCSTFIETDPILIPHLFNKKQDIEIAGFFAAILAWGNRTAIIKKAKLLMSLMDNAPHQFITQHQAGDLKPFMQFVYRTFNATDTLYAIQFLQYHYQQHSSLSTAFFNEKTIQGNEVVENALIHFYHYFFSLEDIPERTRKHIATPEKKSACKRLNMFLRWMIRKDDIDFGIWDAIIPGQLICPLDIHVGRVSRGLGILKRKQNDWNAALELTQILRKIDPNDPVKYDIALLSLALEHRS